MYHLLPTIQKIVSNVSGKFRGTCEVLKASQWSLCFDLCCSEENSRFNAPSNLLFIANTSTKLIFLPSTKHSTKEERNINPENCKTKRLQIFSTTAAVIEFIWSCLCKARNNVCNTNSHKTWNIFKAVSLNCDWHKTLENETRAVTAIDWGNNKESAVSETIVAHSGIVNCRAIQCEINEWPSSFKSKLMRGREETREKVFHVGKCWKMFVVVASW